jgi:hypothetical protein
LDTPSDIAAELNALEAELKRLEAEYNMFFAGRLPRPPWETRTRVQAHVKRLDRMSMRNYGDKFRFTTLQSRFSSFVDLWDRGLRAREVGRSGPFAAPRAAPPPPPPVPAAPASDDRDLHVTTVKDPLRELDKLRDLYNHFVAERSDTTKEAMPFHKFAELVKKQVSALKEKGSGEVTLRVAMRSGKLALTAQPAKPVKKKKSAKSDER